MIIKKNWPTLRSVKEQWLSKHSICEPDFFRCIAAPMIMRGLKHFFLNWGREILHRTGRNWDL